VVCILQKYLRHLEHLVVATLWQLFAEHYQIFELLPMLCMHVLDSDLHYYIVFAKLLQNALLCQFLLLPFWPLLPFRFLFYKRRQLLQLQQKRQPHP
jgi:hypothetical protein